MENWQTFNLKKEAGGELFRSSENLLKFYKFFGDPLKIILGTPHLENWQIFKLNFKKEAGGDLKILVCRPSDRGITYVRTTVSELINRTKLITVSSLTICINIASQ